MEAVILMGGFRASGNYNDNVHSVRFSMKEQGSKISMHDYIDLKVSADRDLQVQVVLHIFYHPFTCCSLVWRGRRSMLKARSLFTDTEVCSVV